MDRAACTLVERLTVALGPPIATPEMIMAWDYATTGRLEPARYRLFRWACPACGGGEDDWLWRPLVVDSDGNVRCEANRCTPSLIVDEALMRGISQRWIDRLGA